MFASGRSHLDQDRFAGEPVVSAGFRLTCHLLVTFLYSSHDFTRIV
jgi:hypothetical protein